MKKEYIEPSVKAIEIEHPVLTIASGPQNQGEAGENVTPDGIDVDFDADFE